MNRPITLCDRCKEYARCCLNYDGGNCRRSRTVEPTNADRIRSMTDEQLAEMVKNPCDIGYYMPKEWCAGRNCGYQCSLDWLKKEAE